MMFPRTIALICAVLVPSTVIADDLLRLALSAGAEACCAAMNGECARLSAPDTCCQTSQKIAGATLTTTSAQTPADHVARAPEAPAPVLDSFPLGPSLFRRAGESFKRPHDPPHLHPFPFLI